ncbi:MAG: CHAT domain-containing protein [Streptosporangiaceae bacterium]|nr:CHAT domain-containing protein [Streptosporangiaceae bacterium]
MKAQPDDFREHVARADELAERFFQNIGDDAVSFADAMDDLSRAIEAMGSAFDMAPGYESRRIAGELGYLFLMRFELEPRVRDDIEDAIRLLRYAAEGDPDLAVAADLGRALAYRYDLDQTDVDRDEAISVLRPVCDTDDSDPSLLVALAEMLTARGEQHSDITDMTDAIEYAERSLALLPDDSSDRESALYSLGVSHLLRADMDPVCAQGDAYAAVTRLGQLQAILAADDHWHPEVTAWYGIALTVRIGTLSGSLRTSNALRRRVDEAIRLLSEAEPGLPDADPLRLRVRFAAALMRVLRSTVLGGTGEDRDLALSELEAIGNTPGCDPAIATHCHYYCALALVTSGLDDGLWRAVSRYDYAAHKRLMAASQTTVGPAPADARRALEHLDQIPELGSASPVTAYEILELRGWTLIHQREGGPAEEDLIQAIACTEEAIRLTPDGNPDLGMRQGQLAQIRAILAEQSGDQSGYRELIEGLTVAAEKLDRDYPLRPLVLGVLGVSVEAHDPGTPASPSDSTAAAELAERALRQIPSDHPARVQVLTRLGEALLKHSVFDHSATHLDRIRALLQDAISHPAADDTNKAMNHYLLGMVDGAAAALGGDAQRFDAAIDQLRYAAGLVPEEHWLRGSILSAISALLGNRFYVQGGLEFLDASDHYARAALQAMQAAGTSTTERAIGLECHLAIAPLRRRLGNLDRHEVLQLVEEATRRLDEVAAPLSDRHLSDLVEHARGQVRAVGSTLSAAVRTENIDRTFLAAAADLAHFVFDIPDVHPDRDDFPFALVMRGNAKVMQGCARRDLKLFNAGLAMYADALGAARAAPPERQWWPNVPTALSALGSALCVRYKLTGNRADLSNGITRLKDARREAVAGPPGLTSAVISYQLAMAYRCRDDPNLRDRRSASESGLEALRDYVRDVLLQSTADRAFDAALSAGDKASVIARWCLDADMAEAAVEALEMGRGMVLHAATTEATVPALLREVGRPDLAAEWEMADGSGPVPWDGAADPEELADSLAGLAQARLPSDLRQRVMAAIEDTEMERSLLTPPGVGEIVDALRVASVDALAYLLPGQKDVQGLGVLVGADGRVHSIPLPKLEMGPHSRVATFADAQREWLQAERAGDETAAIPARRRWRGALADMCDWAWTAGMDTLLAAVPGAQGHPARVVLVPVGKLGLVPWHAARRAGPYGAHRYACQDAIIWYAASARQYVTARRQIPRPWKAEPALVTVDNSGYWAPRAISRIHRRLYPDGLLLAGPEANSKNVRTLLPGPGSPGASLLHVGAHAEPAAHPLGSRLRLDRNESLSMTDLLHQARGRPTEIPGGLMVLAACGTDLTGRAHDEALTLATTFLALGAVGAVGTRWPVKDVPTAVFMAVLHQQLNSGHQDPAAALRATQLWMLDPDRVLPDSIDPALAEEMRTLDLDAVDTWAAYTYQGR